jgi:ATP-dependent metalloprotease
MGGRVAEELIFGDSELSTGCSQDLKQATSIAKELVRNMGYKAKPGLFFSGAKDKLSEDLNCLTDEEIERLLRVYLGLRQDSLQRTRETLSQNKKMLNNLAMALLAKETLSVKEIKELLNLE